MTHDMEAAKPLKRRVDPDDFPDVPRPGTSRVPLTLENVAYMLEQTGITARFNVIKKRLEVRCSDGRQASETEILSLANLNGLGHGNLQPFIFELARRNPVNSVDDWINSKPWDGEDRKRAFYETVQSVEDYPGGLKEVLLNRWLLAATAAATLKDRRFHCRGVLTLQGPQGVGKTSWIASLMPAGPLRDEFVKRDHHLDGGNKDSIIGGISQWITEIGELDSSFRKDVARLKGFLTNDCDKLRPPYARSEVEFDRRTVFAASVNDSNFLVDHTGNSRFWTISVERLDYEHDIDMQQLFAQLRCDLEKGAQWWLTPNEEALLAEYNLRHRSVSATEEQVLDAIDPDLIDTDAGVYMTASEVLTKIGIRSPSNRQAKECGAVLRERIGQPKRVKGRDKWRVPLRIDRNPYGFRSGFEREVPDSARY